MKSFPFDSCISALHLGIYFTVPEYEVFEVLRHTAKYFMNKYCVP